MRERVAFLDSIFIFLMISALYQGLLVQKKRDSAILACMERVSWAVPGEISKENLSFIKETLLATAVLVAGIAGIYFFGAPIAGAGLILVSAVIFCHAISHYQTLAEHQNFFKKVLDLFSQRPQEARLETDN